MQDFAEPLGPSSYLSASLVGRACRAKGGKGVYARVDVPAGMLLVVWGGRVLTRHELEQRPRADRSLTLQVDDDAYLVSEVEGPADWVNHSCDPNAGMHGQISLVAMRAIRAGEEVCFDYAMSDATDYDEFDCVCGAPTCRGRISGSDWARTDLTRRYAGYFSPYIQRRIDARRPPLRARRRAGTTR